MLAFFGSPLAKSGKSLVAEHYGGVETVGEVPLLFGKDQALELRKALAPWLAFNKNSKP